MIAIILFVAGLLFIAISFKFRETQEEEIPIISHKYILDSLQITYAVQGYGCVQGHDFAPCYDFSPGASFEKNETFRVSEIYIRDDDTFLCLTGLNKIKKAWIEQNRFEKLVEIGEVKAID